MQERICNFLLSFNLKPEIVTLFLGAIPVTELRASIPIGILLLKQNTLKVLILSIVGNILPVPFIYYLLEPVSRFLSKRPFMKRFFDWLYKRAKERSDIVQRYEAIGLAIFVGIPLPGTGAWTGCVVASMLRMRPVPSFLAITAGVVIAGLIVTALTLFSASFISSIKF